MLPYVRDVQYSYEAKAHKRWLKCEFAALRRALWVWRSRYSIRTVHVSSWMTETSRAPTRCVALIGRTRTCTAARMARRRQCAARVEAVLSLACSRRGMQQVDRRRNSTSGRAFCVPYCDQRVRPRGARRAHCVPNTRWVTGSLSVQTSCPRPGHPAGLQAAAFSSAARYGRQSQTLSDCQRVNEAKTGELHDDDGAAVSSVEVTGIRRRLFRMRQSPSAPASQFEIRIFSIDLALLLT